MFARLKDKWGVSGWRLALILITFAVGGSLAGFLAKKVMNILELSQDWLYGIVYILVVTLIWPLSVLMVSILFGQFSFFLDYIKRLGSKMGIGRRR